MEHTVIIPEFMPDENIRNFIPEVVKIQMGDTVRWINIGKDSHSLYFFGLGKDLAEIKILKSLYIDPGESKKL